MGADRRIHEFEVWSRGRGRSAREPERRRIVTELYAISEGDLVSFDHVESLVKKYRDGLMGPNAILHARGVADELIAWQDEMGDDLPELDADESSSSLERRGPRGAASARAPARPVYSERPPAPSVRPDPRSERPPPNELDASDPPAVSRAHSEASQKETPLSDHDDLPPLSARRELFDALDEFRSPPSERPPAHDDFESELTREPDYERRSDSERSSRPPPRSRSSRPLPGSLSSRPPTEALSSRPPMRRESERPSERRSPFPRHSSRPPVRADLDDDELVDKSDKKYAKGFDRPPSIRPRSGVDVTESEEGVDRTRASRRSDEISESVAPPRLPIVQMDPEEPPSLSRRLLVWGGVAVPLLAGLGFIMTRPGCSPFTKANARIHGAFRSKHLGIQLEFNDGWMHDETKDDHADASGWDRRVSIFFRGASSSEFSSQLVLAVFSRKDKRATTVDANQLGAAEALGVIFSRRCAPYPHPRGEQGTLCNGLTVRGTQRLAAVEAYFPVEGRVVFARFLLEMPPMMGPTGVDATSLQSGDPLLEALNRKVDDAVATLGTIRTLA